ncbi:hypothetical protein [Actinophytocola glycyrrhizae]|uniref:Uncharacterized protein n=1 Tax=Actinophytocola glycyrrhizae TaxID=2044873 RepID=A0ABV9RTH4_9PSEU
MSRSRRVAVGVIATGAALLGVLSALPPGHDNARLERATTSAAATLSTESTRTSRVMNDQDDETAVRKLAERYLAAVNNHDDATVARLNCARTGPGLIQIAADGRPVTMGRLERASVRDRYYADLTIGGKPTGRMIIVRRDGVWCVRD